MNQTAQSEETSTQALFRDDELKQIVTQRYAVDFDMLGYDTDDVPSSVTDSGGLRGFDKISHIPHYFSNLRNVLQPTQSHSSNTQNMEAKDVYIALSPPHIPTPYVNHLTRTFRLARGKKRYVEVGSRYKGTVSWLAKNVLAGNALLVEVDEEAFTPYSNQLRSLILEDQQLHSIKGNRLDPSIVKQVEAALGGDLADIVFIDTVCGYQELLTEFECYYPLLCPGGFMIFHNCYLETIGNKKGRLPALMQLDRFNPVYAVFADEPTHRIFPRETNEPVWGGCGILIKELE
jgi:predicted O-methyltransferase YrrM